MKSKDLERLGRKELLSLAKERGIRYRIFMTNNKLRKLLAEKREGFPAYTKSDFREVTEGKEKVEQAKFDLGKPQPEFRWQVPQVTITKEEEFRFPRDYGDNKIVVQVRDPWWIHAYWEVISKRQDEVRQEIYKRGLNFEKAILRVYDVTDIVFDGKNAHSFFDIDLHSDADNWYINVGTPNRSWCIDIGMMTKEREFFVLARSNSVRTPRFGMSEVLDEEWRTAEEEYWKMFGLSGGFGIGKSSLELKELFKRRFEEQISSGAISSISSPMAKKERGFWLVVDTELIVYGATEPDAKVTVQGRPITLRRDGTFSLRFSLPNGRQVIPVEAVSSDGEERRRIAPIVTRKTE